MDLTAKVKHLTNGLRSSDDPVMARVRELLVERGIGPDGATLAIMFPDDRELYFAIVVALDGRVYEFDFDHAGGPISEGVLRHWVDITSTYRDGDFAEYVDAAIACSVNG